MKPWNILVVVIAAFVLSGSDVFGSSSAERTSARLSEAASSSPPEDRPKLTGPYLGQKPPGLMPEIFAPGLVSKEGDGTFSPDGNYIFFSRDGDIYWVSVSVIIDLRPEQLANTNI